MLWHMPICERQSGTILFWCCGWWAGGFRASSNWLHQFEGTSKRCYSCYPKDTVTHKYNRCLTYVADLMVLFLRCRISSRSTGADPYLSSTLHMFVSAKNSPAQLIQFKGYFGIKFAKLVQESKGWQCHLAELVTWPWDGATSAYNQTSQVRTCELQSTALKAFKSRLVALCLSCMFDLDIHCHCHCHCLPGPPYGTNAVDHGANGPRTHVQSHWS